MDTVFTWKSKKFAFKKRLAMFDLDGTLVTTKSGKIFPKDADDWRWWDKTVIDSLRQLDRYAIIIITNQGWKSKDKLQMAQQKIKKIGRALEKLDIFVSIFSAEKDNFFRKPRVGIWEQCILPFLEQFSRKKSFYVGNDAGRSAVRGGSSSIHAGSRIKADKTCNDRKFAANVGINFYTPEEYFLNAEPRQFEWGGFDPVKYMQRIEPYVNVDNFKKAKKIANFEPSKQQELLILIGYPGCGKSRFVKQNLPKYKIVSLDICKTAAKSVKLTRQYLQDGYKVVIDNTNPDEASRQRYVEIAEELDVPVRYLYFEVKRDLAQHLNYLRGIRDIENLEDPIDSMDSKSKVVPSFVYNIFDKKFELPKKYITIPFIPQFENEEEKRRFLQWTC